MVLHVVILMLLDGQEGRGDPHEKSNRRMYYLTLEFDSVEEANKYAKGIEEKHQIFKVLRYEELPGDRIRVRIQRQYNNSPFPDILESGEK